MIKSLSIIEILADNRQGLSLQELNNSLNLKKSTVRRLLSTLIYEGFVDEDSVTQKYKLSLKLFIISRKILNNINLTKVIVPLLEALGEEVGETVCFIVADIEEDSLFTCYEFPSTGLIQFNRKLARNLSLTGSAAGIAALATLNDAELDKVLKTHKPKANKDKPVPSMTELRKEIDLARQKGFAKLIGNSLESLCSMAAPVFDETGALIGLLEITVPKFRWNEKRLKELYQPLMNISTKCSQRLGFIPD